MHVFLSQIKCQISTERLQLLRGMSRHSEEMVVNSAIPGRLSACLAIRLAAHWLLGMLTPLDFMRMSEMSMMMIKIKMR